MYTVFNIYRVPKAHADTFLRIQAAAARIYMREGALDDATYVPTAMGKLYGCIPLAENIDIADDEVLMIGVSAFRDLAHHDEVMARVDADPEIDTLFADVQDVIALDRVLRGVFERAV